MTATTPAEVTSTHREIIADLELVGSPEITIYKRMPGFEDGDDTPQLQHGINLASMGQELGRTFSKVQDLQFGTMVILAEATSTVGDESERRLLAWQKGIADTFNSRRVTGLSCELFTVVRGLSVNMPVKLARHYDLIGFEIWTYFRENRG
jgi:hypothetical protein